MPDRPPPLPFVVLSCEHAGNRIPLAWRQAFAPPADVLQSHRGWDPGALALSRRLRRLLQPENAVPLAACHTTRLLIDPNRSLDNPSLWSPWSRVLPQSLQQAAIRQIWQPHRRRIEAQIDASIARHGGCLHLAIHSFTPIWKGRPRSTRLGLLFDPQRPFEAALCRQWQRALRRRLPGLAIHCNRPYQGRSDGLTTSLRHHFPAQRYLGLEIELAQDLAVDHRGTTRIARALADGLHEALRATPGRIPAPPAWFFDQDESRPAPASVCTDLHHIAGYCTTAV